MPVQDEKTVIESFRQQCASQVSELQPADVVIFEDQPVPTNYTIVFRPDDTSRLSIEHLISSLQAIDADQFYYPGSLLHLTVVGFLPPNLEVDKLNRVLQDIVQQHSSWSFRLQGVASNTHSASVTAIPENFSLHDLRTEIRSRIGEHGDDFTRFLKGYEYVGWLNFLRYLRQPEEELLQQLREWEDQDFGVMQPQSIQLYRNTSRVLEPGKAELVWEQELA